MFLLAYVRAPQTLRCTTNVEQVTVMAPHYAMYISPLNFKEPMSFAPERWLGDEKFASDRRAALQPFSVGSRDCLGKK